MTPLDPEDVRWIAWRNEARGKEGKPTKVPYGRGGLPAKADDEGTWLVRAEAENLARRIVNGAGGGLGYELGDVGNDLFVAGIDLDSCIAEDGTLASWRNHRSRRHLRGDLAQRQRNQVVPLHRRR